MRHSGLARLAAAFALSVAFAAGHMMDLLPAPDLSFLDGKPVAG